MLRRQQAMFKLICGRMAARSLCAALVLTAAVVTANAQPRHAIAMHGEPALAQGFTHFAYSNPNAPKGGRLVHGMSGTFDSLNPFIVNGLPLQQIRGYVIESLMTRGYDEPFTLYGLLARSVETDAERTYVSFEIDPDARFSDGMPVTPADVLFSWQLLRDKGRPTHRNYYSKVTHARAIGERSVRFDFPDAQDRELPLILGLMPVLPRHATDPEMFEKTSLKPPIGSGPYVVGDVRAGDSITLRRDPNYWGRDKAVNRGLWNFDEVAFEFYRDANTQFEAFKRGLVNVRAESDAGRWEDAYDFPAVTDGQVIRETLPSGLPRGMSAFVMNTRRPIFADIRVREAIGLLFDFEWVNRNFFSSHYQRTQSFFDGSELSAHGRPADPREREILKPFGKEVRADILEGKWSAPMTDGSGRDRALLKRALSLFAQAGWDLKAGELRNRKTGEQFAFEILVTTKEVERLASSFVRDLRRAGIAPNMRVVDAVQYDRRRQVFDFDMVQNRWDATLSPGNEQTIYWGSDAADMQGSRNYMGIKSKAVDAAIQAMLQARERPEFVSAVRALDRALLSQFAVVPLFHLPDQWIARWSYIQRPSYTSLSGYLPETWWADVAKTKTAQ
jgi:peptide/nickel transport system substrate-binding protein